VSDGNHSGSVADLDVSVNDGLDGLLGHVFHFVGFDDVAEGDVLDGSLGDMVSHGFLDDFLGHFVGFDDVAEGDVLHDMVSVVAVVNVRSRERRTVSSGSNNLEVLVSKFSGDTDVVLGSDDNGGFVSVVYDDMLVSVMVMVHNGSVVGDMVESELAGILGPVSFSGVRDISSSSVESGVVAEVGSRGGHGLLVFLQISSFKNVKRISVLRELEQDFLLEGRTECSGLVSLSHDTVSEGNKFFIEVFNNAGFVVVHLSGMELSEVLSSDGSEFLCLNFTSESESVRSTGLKLSLESSDLFVDDNESHLTFLHGSLSGGSDLSDECSVSLLVGYIDDINFLSVSSSSGHGALLESG